MSNHESHESMPEFLNALQALERLRKVTAIAEAVDVEPARGQAAGGEKFCIGRFVIQRELGRGGVGVVLLAHDPTLKRSVALKVPHLETLLSHTGLRRFEREAQVASRLTHPNIIAVLEADNVGPVSYIASAYTQGVSLAKWLSRHAATVTVEQAVRLIADLAGAMAYAHQQGVLHRDLKPANVILEPKQFGLSVADWQFTPSDEENAIGAGSLGTASGEDSNCLDDFIPKITDFGLAKVLGESLGVTHSKAILGTPAYMTPEQAGGNSADLQATADVYALGVMLYELLTGKPPFGGQNESEILMRIVHKDPLSPRKLRPDLPVELEAVIFKCLEKKPSARYQTAAQFEAELRRFLEGEPLSVRPLSLVGSSVRLTKKHPLTAGLLATVVVLSLAIGAVSTGAYFSARAGLLRERQLLVEAQAARDSAMERGLAEAEARLQAERALAAEKDALQQAQTAEQLANEAQVAAEAEAEKATQVSQMLAELFLTADPMGLASIGLRSGDDVSMNLPLQELLARGSRYARKNLKDQPLVNATVLDTIGRVYSNLGQTAEAAPLLEDAYALRLEHGATEAELATSRLNLGLLRFWQGKFREAETLVEESLQMRSELFGSDELQVAEALLSLAIIKVFGRPEFAVDENYFKQLARHYAECDQILERAHAIRLNKLGPKHRDVGLTMTALAMSKFNQRRTDEAQQLLYQATAIYAQQEGGNLLLRAATSVAKGTMERKQMKFAEAIEHYRQALPILQEHLGKRHVMTLMLMGELAGTLRDSGRIIEGEPLALEVIDLAQATMPDHPLLSQPLGELHNFALQRGDFEAAERFSEMLARIEAQKNGVVSDSGKNWHQASLAIMKGEFAEADELLKLYPSNLNAPAGKVQLTRDRQHYLRCQAELALCLGETDRGYQMLRKIVDETGDISKVLHDILCILGILERKQNSSQGAQKWLIDPSMSLVQWLEKAHDGLHPAYPDETWPLFIVGRQEIEQGRVEVVEQELLVTWEYLQQCGLPGSWYLGYAECVMGLLEAARNHADQAESHLLSGLSTLKQARGAGHWLIREAAEMLVDFYRQQGRDSDAMQYEEWTRPASLQVFLSLPKPECLKCKQETPTEC